MSECTCKYVQIDRQCTCTLYIEGHIKHGKTPLTNFSF